MTQNREDSADLLHSLGYIYLKAGQEKRALMMLLLANQIEPENAGILRTLTSALLENGSSKRALAALDRLADLEPVPGEATPLLRARALWMMGEEDEAKRCFAAYVTQRNAS